MSKIEKGAKRMQTVKSMLNKIVKEGFVAARYDEAYAEVVLSSRPDLCDYQCSGALRLAKVLKMNPIEIASHIVKTLESNKDPLMDKVEVCPPGFINVTLSKVGLASVLNTMQSLPKLGYDGEVIKKRVIVDFGGANVAKSLHVGHLRSAVIGESIKRLYRYSGHEVIGDIHLGDWGLQMGYVIVMLREQAPQLSYFDPECVEDYPIEPPFDIAGLSALYTAANLRSKEDPDFKEAARQATAELQAGRKGYYALWQHILKVSVADLRSNYQALNVVFDLWLGESDSQIVIPTVLDRLETMGLLEESDGAKVVFVAEPSDKKTVPPCIMVKANGASLYGTTDLATIYQRVTDYQPNEIVYVVDKRQGLHFEQVFRVARKSGIAADAIELNFIGFGTMNGSDGKPFKTRDGGVMALEDLILLLRNTAKEKITLSGQNHSQAEMDHIAIQVGLAAMKFADLSNQAERDYVFDLNQFASFEGKTGPYIQYAVVRMSAILGKAEEIVREGVKEAKTQTELELQKSLVNFHDVLLTATVEKAPHKLCEYAYDVAHLFNRFYHESRILDEPDLAQKKSWLSLIQLTKEVLSISLDLLGIDALEKM